MRILKLHCDYIYYKPKKLAVKQGADEVTKEDLEGKKVEEVLVVFTAVENGDSQKEVSEAVVEIKKMFETVKAQNVVIYPYAHLSSNLASLKDAPTILARLYEETKKSVTPNTFKSQFGWYKEFELKCKGHPLSELSKTIGESKGETTRKPKAGTAHTIHEVIYSVMLEEPQNRGFAKDKNAYRLTTALSIAALLKQKDKNVGLGLMQLNENGFYVDIDLHRSLSPKELPELQKELENFISTSHPITQKLVSKEQAEKIFAEQKEPYLLELAQKLPEHAFLNLYCMDEVSVPSLVPLLDNANELRAIHLAGVGGAYWLNDSSKPQLQRIAGFSFPTKEALTNFLELQEKAKDRDHRKLGLQLDLFSVHDVAPGMAFFHPKGMIIRNELEKYWRELNHKYGHVEIRTPILMDAEVWKNSGHWDHYKENMYFTQIDGKLNGVKPMNCPGAIIIFKNTRRSYRELPLRLAELGLVHRHEFSGVLSGLFRVRAFTQDDSHVFCAQEDIESEVEARLRYLDEFYHTFGFEYTLELSTRPPKRLGTDEQWDIAENALKKALDKLGKKYKINEGDGAFYGPKIDFHIKDSLGRTWQCATEQLDFQMPLRFDVTFVDKDGKEANPAMLHSVAHGSVERFYAILVEHFEGKFPTWLAPIQVAVITVSDDQKEYAKQVYDQLRANGIRVELEDKTGTVGAKIRNWQQQKVPYMVIIGEQEVGSNTISIRDRKGSETHNANLSEFVKTIHLEIEKRK
ncbi:putative threonine--tRNA ligase 1 [Candidatus Bilamarchaeum dharawalense]|uniref:Threonine--tRNA ligase n=1 Tax=Candidatus Bilamarchaeum dharawalense TaxID=2885759 RepID=A0A5E4LRU9_9ARCH|nr:putative threonine--tRNA ligase 1 [Candidatus Bilamarchaeum dharawalense]